MNKLVLGMLVIVGAFGVGLADVLIKKAAAGGSFLAALRNPLIIVVALLYAFQIVLYTYVFVKNYQLGILGVAQSLVYILVTIIAGILFFKEEFTWPQKIGMVLAIAGIVLLNF